MTSTTPSSVQENERATRASWEGFSCRLAITPGSSWAAPLVMKCRPIRVFPIPEGPAQSVVEPGQ